MAKAKKNYGELAIGDKLLTDPPQYVVWVSKVDGIVSYGVSDEPNGECRDFHEAKESEPVELETAS